MVNCLGGGGEVVKGWSF